ncbi:MAG: sel1 repeat family protein, partial [Gammaproteobacteria bacterium]|nr:sel1 repeat family protein [Gammaproteobacteria bacterium]
WLPPAENGDIRAQYAIGRLYEKGRGVERNFETAISWYRKAAERGHADSEYRIAVGYAYGLGVARDEAEGLSWLRRAANHGQKRAQKVLAQAYEEGRLGLKADPERAKYWYDKAGSGS